MKLMSACQFNRINQKRQRLCNLGSKMIGLNKKAAMLYNH